jgi:hypothetical protein
MDNFNKWPEVYAIPDQEASKVVDALSEQFLVLLQGPERGAQ